MKLYYDVNFDFVIIIFGKNSLAGNGYIFPKLLLPKRTRTCQNNSLGKLIKLNSVLPCLQVYLIRSFVLHELRPLTEAATGGAL